MWAESGGLLSEGSLDDFLEVVFLDLRPATVAHVVVGYLRKVIHLCIQTGVGLPEQVVLI